MTLHPLTIEILAAVFGVAGTILLALKGPWAGWGFVAYLASNAASLAFFWIQQHWALFAQQIAYMVGSLLGVWVWLLAPRAAVFRSVYATTRVYRGRWRSARVAFRCTWS